MAGRADGERSIRRLTRDLRTVAFYCHRSFECDFLREKVVDFPSTRHGGKLNRRLSTLQIGLSSYRARGLRGLIGPRLVFPDTRSATSARIITGDAVVSNSGRASKNM